MKEETSDKDENSAFSAVHVAALICSFFVCFLPVLFDFTDRLPFLQKMQELCPIFMFHTNGIFATAKTYARFSQPVVMCIFNLGLSNNPSQNPVFARVFAVYNCTFYVFSLVFALTSRNKGKFLFSANYFIQQSCGAALRFPCSVSVDIHGGTDIAVSQKLLHIFGGCAVCQQVTGEGVSEHMKVEVLKSLHLLVCSAAHHPNRAGAS